MAKALEEKALAVSLWVEIATLTRRISWSDANRGAFVMTSAEYGLRLFRVVYHGWRVLTAGFAGEQTGQYDAAEIEQAAGDYFRAWADYRNLAVRPTCASLYEGRYFNLPGLASESGLDGSVQHYLRVALQSPASFVTQNKR